MPPTTTRGTCCSGSRTEGPTMRNSETKVDRRLTASSVPAVLVLLGAAAIAGAGSPAVAAEPAGATQPAAATQIDAATQIHAQRIAVAVCGTCHGQQGNSTQPKFPRLAGQHANYLAAQLKAFRSQSRGDPDAIGYMWGMAAELDDATIDALGAY